MGCIIYEMDYLVTAWKIIFVPLDYKMGRIMNINNLILVK